MKISHTEIKGCTNFLHWALLKSWQNAIISLSIPLSNANQSSHITGALKHLTLFYPVGSVTSSSCGFGFESRSACDGTLCGLRPQIIMSPLLFRQAARINTALFTHAARVHGTTFQRMKGCYYGCLRSGLGSAAAKRRAAENAAVYSYGEILLASQNGVRFSDNKLMCFKRYSQKRRVLVCFYWKTENRSRADAWKDC